MLYLYNNYSLLRTCAELWKALSICSVLFFIRGEVSVITIYDISRETGFSIATVSKVINGYKGVNIKTRETIQKKIEELGYVPNSTARTLTTKRSWLIAVVLAVEGLWNGIVHPHYSQIIQSFQKEIGSFGYDIIFLNPFMGERKLSGLEHCKYRNVDGILLAVNSKFTDEVQDIIEGNIPMVSVETVYNGIPTVISDNVMSATQAMEHLYFLGHRKIAHLAGPLVSIAGRERCEGYKMFLESNGIDFQSKYLVEATDYSPQSGAEAFQVLLHQCWDDLPTAIYLAYDNYAASVIEVLRNQGFRVPKDISIVGNDDLPQASYMTPGLTTVRQNREELGIKAAKLLQEQKEQQKVSSIIAKVPTKLIVRQTTYRKYD